jgi:hypothetical protein
MKVDTKALIELIAKSLVDNSGEVVVSEMGGEKNRYLLLINETYINLKEVYMVKKSVIFLNNRS